MNSFSLYGIVAIVSHIIRMLEHSFNAFNVLSSYVWLGAKNSEELTYIVEEF